MSIRTHRTRLKLFRIIVPGGNIYYDNYIL